MVLPNFTPGEFLIHDTPSGRLCSGGVQKWFPVPMNVGSGLDIGAITSEGKDDAEVKISSIP